LGRQEPSEQTAKVLLHYVPLYCHSP
jgi:hypothetical protein